MNNYRLAVKNPLQLESKTKIRPGKHKRHLKKLQKIKAKGWGCPWKNDGVVFRLEIFWENKLGEQANFQLHWITVRKIKGKEKRKYLDYFNNCGTPLDKGETVELRHLLCYLDSYYQQIKDKISVNVCFIFPAKRVGDSAIRYPVAQRIWKKEEFLEVPLNSDILAVFRNTIYHQQEIKDNFFKTIEL